MNELKKTWMTFSCLVLSVVVARGQALGQNSAKMAPVSDAEGRAATGPVTRLIVVSLADRRLALVEDGDVKKVYRVAVGRESSPSPTGTFALTERVENPTYYHEGKVLPPGPGNPVGTRWMGLSRKGYGIHGTNEPHSIGRAASHGCIRMRRRDLEELFDEVKAGDTVEIIGERNDKTAAIFGGALPGAPGIGVRATQTVVAASDTAGAGQTAADEAATPAPASE
jgi:lipoprotein-anchoring transpeptidase ErfK/SrfK